MGMTDIYVDPEQDDKFMDEGHAVSAHSIYLKDFKLKGADPFYTRSVFFYIRKAGVTFVSSIEEIDSLKAKVKQAMIPDTLISNNIDKDMIINRYFSALEIAFRSLYTEAKRI